MNGMIWASSTYPSLPTHLVRRFHQQKKKTMIDRYLSFTGSGRSAHSFKSRNAGDAVSALACHPYPPFCKKLELTVQYFLLLHVGMTAGRSLQESIGKKRLLLL